MAIAIMIATTRIAITDIKAINAGWDELNDDDEEELSWSISRP